jgi:RNA polymerase-binding transcription factor DksA
MPIDLPHFKEALEREKKKLERELKTVGRKNPDNPRDWEPVPGQRDISQADDNTVADSIEDYEDNAAILSSLETRYRDIESGLDKIKHKTYGVCEVCGKAIEVERLEVNPAARTCLEHINEK